MSERPSIELRTFYSLRTVRYGVYREVRVYYVDYRDGLRLANLSITTVVYAVFSPVYLSGGNTSREKNKDNSTKSTAMFDNG